MDYETKHVTNSTTPDQWVLNSSAIILLIATVVGTWGNLFLLLVISTTKQIWTSEAVLVMNLALSDLYVTAVADPLGIIGTCLLPLLCCLLTLCKPLYAILEAFSPFLTHLTHYNTMPHFDALKIYSC